MKHGFRINQLKALMLLALALTNAPALAQLPPTTAFTYQGELMMLGEPLSGTADLEFSLWNHPSNPLSEIICNDPMQVCPRVGIPLRLEAVPVNEGQFSVHLDFGPAVFGAEARWLEIAVRSPHDPGDTAAMTILSPRQAITAPPHAGPAASPVRRHETVPGLVGSAVGEDCLVNELGFNCKERNFLTIALLDGVITAFEIDTSRTIQQGGEPVTIMETVEVEFEKHHGSGVASGTYRVEARAKMLDPQGVVHNHEFTLTFDDPVYSIDQPGYGFRFVAQLINEDMVRLVFKDYFENLKFIESESLGIIKYADFIPYQATDRLLPLAVTIQNYGDLKAPYLVTVTECPPNVAPVAPQYSTLEPAEEVTLEFVLRSQEPFTAGETCKATLKASTGRLYDVLQVSIPQPGTSGGS
jgi:hypothetical protein